MIIIFTLFRWCIIFMLIKHFNLNAFIFVVQKALLKFNYSVQEESDTCLGGRWSFDDVPMKPLRTVIVVPADGIPAIMDKLKDYLSLWASLQTPNFYRAAMQDCDHTIFAELLLSQRFCTTRNIHQVNIFKYYILFLFGIITKQSIKTQCQKKTWISVQCILNQS